MNPDGPYIQRVRYEATVRHSSRTIAIALIARLTPGATAPPCVVPTNGRTTKSSPTHGRRAPAAWFRPDARHKALIQIVHSPRRPRRLPPGRSTGIIAYASPWSEWALLEALKQSNAISAQDAARLRTWFAGNLTPLMLTSYYRHRSGKAATRMRTCYGCSCGVRIAVNDQENRSLRQKYSTLLPQMAADAVLLLPDGN